MTIDYQILDDALALALDGRPKFYGFEMARRLAGGQRRVALVGHGTLYKALARLQASGYLSSEWEDPAEAAAERRPVRRFYQITKAGAAAFESVLNVQASPVTT